MSSINLVQILPSLNSGGVERGTIDLANFLSKKKLSNHIISNGGSLLSKINRDYTSHHLLPVNSKNLLLYPFIAKKYQIILSVIKLTLFMYVLDLLLG